MSNQQKIPPDEAWFDMIRTYIDFDKPIGPLLQEAIDVLDEHFGGIKEWVERETLRMRKAIP